MKRFGLPVTTFTFAILAASALSWNDAVNTTSFSYDSARAYVSAAENGALYLSDEITLSKEVGSTLTLPLTSSNVIDGATVTADLSAAPLGADREDLFLYVLLAVSLVFVVTGIRNTFRSSRTPHDS